MRIRTETVREGELLGPIDWSYDFRQHFNNYGCPEAVKDSMCAARLEILKQIETDPMAWRVNVNDYWHDLIAVGMYDGWPYWKPTPAILVSGTLGPEWHFFYDLRGAKPATEGKPEA